MTRLEIENSLKDLNNLVLDGKMMEAFDKYYHENVSMQENELPAMISKESNRKRELEFLENIIEFRGAKVEGLAVGDNLSFVIWHYDYTHKEWGVRNYSQISVQKWDNGKIINEKFVYTS